MAKPLAGIMCETVRFITIMQLDFTLKYSCLLYSWNILTMKNSYVSFSGILLHRDVEIGSPSVDNDQLDVGKLQSESRYHF